MKVALALVAMTALAHADAPGATVSGTIKVSRPKDVPEGRVLVYLVGFDEKAPSTPVVVKQSGKTFVPDLAAVTAGGTVSFPNGDAFLHNVFSPTSDRTFDLGSFGKGEARSRTFPKRGVIDIYCNIHPEMSATLVILPNTKFAFVDGTGHFKLEHVPPGKWTIFAFSRRAAKPVSAQIEVGNQPLTIDLALEEQQKAFTHPNKYGETYKPSTGYP